MLLNADEFFKGNYSKLFHDVSVTTVLADFPTFQKKQSCLLINWIIIK